MGSQHPTLEILSAYTERDLPDRDVQDLEVHLADCAFCRGELKSLEKMVVAVGQLPPISPPPGFAAAVLIKVNKHRSPAFWAWLRRWNLLPLLGPLAATGLILLVLRQPGSLDVDMPAISQMERSAGDKRSLERVHGDPSAPEAIPEAIPEAMVEGDHRRQDSESVGGSIRAPSPQKNEVTVSEPGLNTAPVPSAPPMLGSLAQHAEPTTADDSLRDDKRLDLVRKTSEKGNIPTDTGEFQSGFAPVPGSDTPSQPELRAAEGAREVKSERSLPAGRFQGTTGYGAGSGVSRDESQASRSLSGVDTSAGPSPKLGSEAGGASAARLPAAAPPVLRTYPEAATPGRAPGEAKKAAQESNDDGYAPAPASALDSAPAPAARGLKDTDTPIYEQEGGGAAPSSGAREGVEEMLGKAKSDVITASSRSRGKEVKALPPPDALILVQRVPGFEVSLAQALKAIRGRQVGKDHLEGGKDRFRLTIPAGSYPRLTEELQKFTRIGATPPPARPAGVQTVWVEVLSFPGEVAPRSTSQPPAE